MGREPLIYLDRRVELALAGLSRVAAEEIADELRLAKHLRRELPDDLARAAAALHALRGRARNKFQGAERLFFTSRSLEQASDWRVAACRARRVLARAPGASLLDATAGVGGDSLGLVAAGIETLVSAERDAGLVTLLRENLVRSERTVTRTLVLRARAQEPAVRAELLLLDPDRRAAEDGHVSVSPGKRIGDPKAWSPSWSSCIELARRFAGACIKLAPGVDVDRLETPGGDLRCSWQWTSLGHELKEVCLWTGVLARDAEREVVALGRDGSESARELEAVLVPALTGIEARGVDWVADPDPGLLRSNRLGAVARAAGLRPLGGRGAYLGAAAGCESPQPHPLLRLYRVLDRAPLDPRAVRTMLARHEIGPLTVKKRGVSEDAHALARRLKGRGKRRGLLLVARLDDGHQAFLVEPAP